MTAPITPSALAEACEALADECERGEGPELGTTYTFSAPGVPCCAVGHVAARAGCPIPYWAAIPLHAIRRALGVDRELSPAVYEAVRDVAAENDAAASVRARRAAVVQPLRNLARALRAMEIA
jgi:hypothetical protein